MDPLPLLDQIREAENEFTDAMDDDFNTPRALAALFNLTRDMNIALRGADGLPELSLGNAMGLAGEMLCRLGSVLGGLFEGTAGRGYSLIASQNLPFGRADGFPSVSQDEYRDARDVIESTAASGRPVPDDKIRIIVEYRAQCRDRKDWTTADTIRAWLANLGVVVDDTGNGVRWHMKATYVKTQRP
jgi:cysteinyl-tRNA synthetase